MQIQSLGLLFALSIGDVIGFPDRLKNFEGRISRHSLHSEFNRY